MSASLAAETWMRNPHCSANMSMSAFRLASPFLPPGYSTPMHGWAYRSSKRSTPGRDSRSVLFTPSILEIGSPVFCVVTAFPALSTEGRRSTDRNILPSFSVRV